jgi:hypothetical protein
MRYKLTPKRRSSILKAQRISARKRKNSKDTVGYWIARGARMAGNKGTLGVAGMVADLKELNDAAVRSKKRRRRG